jgi:hypothetical protein
MEPQWTAAATPAAGDAVGERRAVPSTRYAEKGARAAMAGTVALKANLSPRNVRVARGRDLYMAHGTRSAPASLHVNLKQLGVSEPGTSGN